VGGSPSFDQGFHDSGGEAVLRKYQNVVLRFERALLDTAAASGRSHSGGAVHTDIASQYLRRLSSARFYLPTEAVIPALPLYLHGTADLVGCIMDYVPDWQSFAQHASSWDVTTTTRSLVQLHGFIVKCHQMGVIIGEMSPHNFGLSGGSFRALDVLAYQYPGLPCTTVYPGTVDPALLKQDETLHDSAGEAYKLEGSYSSDSDWYGFCCLVLQSLTGVLPWAGAHRLSMYAPELGRRRVKSLRGLSVFDSSIRLGKTLRPLESLREELYEYLYAVFTHGTRGPFPVSLLTSLRWVRCPACGSEVSADFCPCGHKVRHR
jgi:hypothetical protein